MRPFFYNLSRHQLSGALLSHWLLILLMVGAAATALGWVGGGWQGTALWSMTLVGIAGTLHYFQQGDFVVFKELPPPTLEPKPLPVSAKIPIHATGHFTVEGKEQRFSWLQGFFRTFATREHAAICLAPARRFLGLGTWPENEVGMWYCFLQPRQILRMRWGQLYFSGSPSIALAINYRLHIPRRGRFSRERTVNDTFYLACHNEDDARSILADLLYDQVTAEQSPDGAERKR